MMQTKNTTRGMRVGQRHHEMARDARDVYGHVIRVDSENLDRRDVRW